MSRCATDGVEKKLGREKWGWIPVCISRGAPGVQKLCAVFFSFLFFSFLSSTVPQKREFPCHQKVIKNKEVKIWDRATVAKGNKKSQTEMHPSAFQ